MLNGEHLLLASGNDDLPIPGKIGLDEETCDGPFCVKPAADGLTDSFLQNVHDVQSLRERAIAALLFSWELNQAAPETHPQKSTMKDVQNSLMELLTRFPRVLQTSVFRELLFLNHSGRFPSSSKFLHHFMVHLAFFSTSSDHVMERKLCLRPFGREKKVCTEKLQKFLDAVYNPTSLLLGKVFSSDFSSYGNDVCVLVQKLIHEIYSKASKQVIGGNVGLRSILDQLFSEFGQHLPLLFQLINSNPASAQKLLERFLSQPISPDHPGLPEASMVNSVASYPNSLSEIFGDWNNLIIRAKCFLGKNPAKEENKEGTGDIQQVAIFHELMKFSSAKLRQGYPYTVVWTIAGVLHKLSQSKSLKGSGTELLETFMPKAFIGTKGENTTVDLNRGLMLKMILGKVDDRDVLATYTYHSKGAKKSFKIFVSLQTALKLFFQSPGPGGIMDEVLRTLSRLSGCTMTKLKIPHPEGVWNHMPSGKPVAFLEPLPPQQLYELQKKTVTVPLHIFSFFLAHHKNISLRWLRENFSQIHVSGSSNSGEQTVFRMNFKENQLLEEPSLPSPCQRMPDPFYGSFLFDCTWMFWFKKMTERYVKLNLANMVSPHQTDPIHQIQTTNRTTSIRIQADDVLKVVKTTDVFLCTTEEITITKVEPGSLEKDPNSAGSLVRISNTLPSNGEPVLFLKNIKDKSEVSVVSLLSKNPLQKSPKLIFGNTGTGKTTSVLKDLETKKVQYAFIFMPCTTTDMIQVVQNCAPDLHISKISTLCYLEAVARGTDPGGVLLVPSKTAQWVMAQLACLMYLSLLPAGLTLFIDELADTSQHKIFVEAKKLMPAGVNLVGCAHTDVGARGLTGEKTNAEAIAAALIFFNLNKGSPPTVKKPFSNKKRQVSALHPIQVVLGKLSVQGSMTFVQALILGCNFLPVQENSLLGHAYGPLLAPNRQCLTSNECKVSCFTDWDKFQDTSLKSIALAALLKLFSFVADGILGINYVEQLLAYSGDGVLFTLSVPLCMAVLVIGVIRESAEDLQKQQRLSEVGLLLIGKDTLCCKVEIGGPEGIEVVQGKPPSKKNKNTPLVKTALLDLQNNILQPELQRLIQNVSLVVVPSYEAQKGVKSPFQEKAKILVILSNMSAMNLSQIANALGRTRQQGGAGSGDMIVLDPQLAPFQLFLPELASLLRYLEGRRKDKGPGPTFCQMATVVKDLLNIDKMSKIGLPKGVEMDTLVDFVLSNITGSGRHSSQNEATIRKAINIVFNGIPDLILFMQEGSPVDNFFLVKESKFFCIVFDVFLKNGVKTTFGFSVDKLRTLKPGSREFVQNVVGQVSKPTPRDCEPIYNRNWRIQDFLENERAKFLQKKTTSKKRHREIVPCQDVVKKKGGGEFVCKECASKSLSSNAPPGFCSFECKKKQSSHTTL